MHVRLHSDPRSAAGVEISAPATAGRRSSTHGRPSSTALPSWRLDTGFQQALSTSRWRLAKTRGRSRSFEARHVRPTRVARFARDARRAIPKVQNATWGDSWVSVHATHPTTLKRSMEWICRGGARPPSTSRDRQYATLHVERTGLIQQVTRARRGPGTVHFHYHAPLHRSRSGGDSAGGFACSIAGAVVFARLAFDEGEKVGCSA